MNEGMERAFTLLEIVTRASTHDGEALNAARQLGKMSERVGGLKKLFPSGSQNSAYSPPLSFNESRRQTENLERERDEARARVQKSEADNSRLLAQNAQLHEENARLKSVLADRVSKKTPDGQMPFNDFVYKVKIILGTSEWRQEFERQTGFDQNAIARAARDGVVSSEFVATLTALRPKHKASFSIEEVRDIRKWNRTHNDIEIAEKATNKFGRVITTAMLRKLRTDLRMQNGAFADKAYGGPIVFGSRNAVFQWDQFPELEKLVCDNQFISNRKSAIELSKIVSQRSGIVVKDGAIKQRCDNAGPPEYMIKGITGVGPLTWPELWYLGAKLRKRGWKQNVFTYLGVAQRSGGESLADIPQDSVESLRRTAKLRE